MRKTILVLVMFFLSCGTTDKGNESEIAECELMQVAKGECETQSEYSAQIFGKTDIKIYPRIEGYLQKVMVKEGERVRKGQLLFSIDQAPLLSALKAAEASVMSAEALVEKALKDYEAKQLLHQRNVVSDFDLEQTKREVGIAKANLAAAKAEYASARNSLDFSQLRSPSDGVVGRINFRRGDLVGPTMSEPLTVISDNSQMYACFSLSERVITDYLCRYGSMDKVIENMPKPVLRLSNGEIYSQTGEVESISAVVESSTSAVSVRAVFSNPDKLLLSGSSGRIVFSSPIKDAIVVPCEAAFELLDKTYICKIVNQRATNVLVEAERVNNGKSLVITKGLQEGDTIVAKGVGSIAEGTKVKDRHQITKH